MMSDKIQPIVRIFYILFFIFSSEMFYAIIKRYVSAHRQDIFVKDFIYRESKHIKISNIKTINKK